MLQTQFSWSHLGWCVSIGGSRIQVLPLSLEGKVWRAYFLANLRAASLASVPLFEKNTRSSWEWATRDRANRIAGSVWYKLLVWVILRAWMRENVIMSILCACGGMILVWLQLQPIEGRSDQEHLRRCQQWNRDTCRHLNRTCTFPSHLWREWEALHRCPPSPYQQERSCRLPSRQR